MPSPAYSNGERVWLNSGSDRQTAMDWSSWFRRSSRNSKKNSKNLPQPNYEQQLQDQGQGKGEEEEELLGVTEELINHVKSFTLDSFKNFPLQREEEETSSTTASTSANVRKDLSEWQERHAILVLSKVKELSQLRFKLSPGYLKERDFWRIYFTLVKSHIAEYELQAIRVAKLRSMALKNEKSADTSAVEVELAETKQTDSLEPSTP